MRSTLFFIIFSLQTGFVFSQNTDSLLAVRQVDSLLKASRPFFIGKREFDYALEVTAAAEKIALEKLGRASVAYGNCCFNRGSVNLASGKFPEAEKWYLETRAIREKALGKEHPDYAQILGGLAGVYGDMANYEKAEPLYLEAIAIREKVLGKEHFDYGRIIVNLSYMYLKMGNYEKVEPLYLEYKTIQGKVNGTQHPKYAEAVNKLALLYYDMGNYEKVEPLYLESKAIREKATGKEHQDYAGSIINMAILYKSMGSYEKAEQLYLEAKDIFETKLCNTKHRYYFNCLNNLAVLYMDVGKYEKAEPLYLEAKTLRENALGKEHIEYAESLHNLASLYVEMGNSGKAEPLFHEAKTIREKVSGSQSPIYAESLHSLASLYVEMGNSGKAEPLYLEAKAIQEKVFGKEHPDYARSLNSLQVLYEKQKRFSESDSLAGAAMLLQRNRLSNSAAFLSELELSKYAATFRQSGNKLGTNLLARPSGKTGSLPELAFDHSLFHKGFLLTAVARLGDLSAASPESVEINNRLKGYRRRLAAEYANPIAERKGIAELEEKANAAEKELARTVSGYAENARQVKWQEVQSALKDDEAAIEFIHFRVNSPKATDSVMYAALILKKGSPQPVFIPLFEEKTLAAFLSRGLATGARKSGYVNQIYGLQNPDGKTLYQLVWQPLESELAGVKKVYFSPSGLLHQLKLGAIPVSKNEVLADRFRFVQLGSTRQLAVSQSLATNSGGGATERSGKAVLLGGIQFDMDENAISKANAGFSARNLDGTSRSLGSELDFSKTDSMARGGDWSYLNWTEKEVDALDSILALAGLKTEVFKGFSATEEAFKNLKSPRILHIATHGYFFPDPAVGRQPSAVNRDEPIFKISEHPMIRSGLILAGGNHAWKNGSPLKPGMEDGILTAYEISQMDLSGTELVVLSACETGLGEIQGSEGVYGLQRAFKIAGAKHLMMSLWQVPDFQTQELMTAFYKNYLTDKMPLPDAFRAAQNEIRKKYLHPYFWAGFVLVE